MARGNGTVDDSSAGSKPKPGVKPSTKPAAGAELAGNYGVSWAIIQSDPDLMAWFNDWAKRYAASGGKLSQQSFTMELQQQPWWKQHSASWIADRQQELEDPVGYEQALTSDVASVQNVANAMGAKVDPATALEIAKSKRRFGWNDSQLQSALAAHVDVSGGDLTGNAGNTQDELMLWAKKNGLTLSPDLVGKYTQRVAAGELTVDDVKGDIRGTYMAGAYPGWADKIQAGFDVADLAAPYQEAVHTLLEDRTIGLDDPLMKKMLQSVDSAGKPVVMPLYEAEKMVRADKRWQKTDNAYQLYANAAQNILRTWGFA